MQLRAPAAAEQAVVPRLQWGGGGVLSTGNQVLTDRSNRGTMSPLY